MNDQPAKDSNALLSVLTVAPLKKTGFSNAFSEESDDESGGTSNLKDVGRVNSLLTQKSAAAERQANKIHNEALAEDPSAFDYDNVYDSFKAPEIKTHALSQPNSKEEAPVSLNSILNLFKFICR